jgi:Bax protein
MQHRFSAWLLGFAFLAYALGCLVLTLALTLHPPTIEELQPLPMVPATKTQLPDLGGISHIPERKRAFIDLLLPIVEERNRFLLGLREELLQMQARMQSGKPLTRLQRQRLEQLRIRYQVSAKDYPDQQVALEQLLLRLDMLPPAMVLAQAAAESGWGTSRFAVEANNLFGQWCFTPGCGLVPARRPEGARHEVQKFDSVESSLLAYYRNINTHRAYRDLRARRAELRAAGEPLTGHELVGQLLHYSSRGQDYVDELRSLISFNQLEQLSGEPQAEASE